ncbi:hypothetical protein BGZ94_003056 [Podila epigama]|nr:hypothetical protein BGZ94_003056 [Podila epigama]
MAHAQKNTTPCPPYNLAPDDFSAQANAGMMARDTSAETEDIEQIGDPIILKRMLMEKEQERQHLVANLDLAARLGLGLQQQLEQVEINSYAKLQSLQDQNMMLQSKANQAMELSSQLTGSEDEVKTLTGHNASLQRELDNCRRDLKSFRKELDGLVEQMTEMGAEVVEAKSKVNTYARRLGEVEQELSSTQEMNVNLQVQLENALERQRQSHSTTTQVVKMIQSDLGKVVSESGTIRSTLDELENRQVKCEGKVVEMITNTREYAHLLEEAQDTIHHLRHESDMEGRGWPQGHALTKNKLGVRRQLTSLAQENPELSNGLEEDDDEDEEQEDEQEQEQEHPLDLLPTDTSSLGAQLGRKLDQDKNEDDSWSEHQSMDAALPEPKESAIETPPSSPSSYVPMSSSSTTTKQTPVSSPQAIIDHQAVPPKQPAPAAEPKDSQTQTDDILLVIPRDPPQQTLSHSLELHQRLEEHSNNILQQGSTRPPWNPSVALDNVITSPSRQRSPSSMRTSSSRSVSQSHMSPRITGSRIGFSGMPSPHTSLSSSMSSLSDVIAGSRSKGAAPSLSSVSEKDFSLGPKSLASESATGQIQGSVADPATAKTKAKVPPIKRPLASNVTAATAGATATRQPVTRERSRATTISGGGDRVVGRRATTDSSTAATTMTTSATSIANPTRNPRPASRSRSTVSESRSLHSSTSASSLSSSSRSSTPAGRSQQPSTTIAIGRQSPARGVSGSGPLTRAKNGHPHPPLPPPSPTAFAKAVSASGGPRSTVTRSGRNTPSPANLNRLTSCTPPLQPELKS